MHYFKQLSLFFAVVFCKCLFASAYDYDEILKLNASCSPKDTCSLPRDLDDSDQHNCDCSSLCVLYDTCCIDSPFLDSNSFKFHRSITCRSAGSSDKHVFMVDVCPAFYDGPFRRRCEQNAKDWSDPFLNIPVTNPLKQTTYKSIFCGLCNGENSTDLVMWQVLLDCANLKGNMKVCQEDKDFVLRNMMYINEKAQWGIWSHDLESDYNFRYLTFNFKMPEGLKDYVKGCRPKLVSKCKKDWKDDRDKRLCEAYMGAVYFPNASYRNVHCAVCNGEEDMSSMSCHETKISAFKGPTMNFGMLLDLNLSHGDKVGEVEAKCSPGQVFDPFAKRCRTLECPLPGYSLKEGKCAPD